MQKLIMFEGKKVEGADGIGHALYDQVEKIRQARHCTSSEALHFIAAMPQGRKLLSAWQAMGTMDDEEVWALTDARKATSIEDW